MDARAVLNALSEAILVVSKAGVVTSANPAAVELFGRSQVLVGRSLGQLFVGGGGEALASLLDDGLVGRGAQPLALLDGRAVDFSVSRPGTGHLWLTLLPVRDGARSDAAVLVARRQASLSRLAGGVVRELNDPVSVILGRSELVASLSPASPSLDRQLDAIRAQCRRLQLVVSNLQTLAAPSAVLRGPARIDDVVSRALAAAAPRVGRVEVEVDVEPPSLVATVDEQRLVGLLTNLIVVAADATTQGLSVGVAARRDSGGIRLSVADHGPGLRADVLASLRSPYAAEGTGFNPRHGVGLAVAWTQAQDQGGWLTAENRAGGGTTFHVWLPDGERTLRPERLLAVGSVLVVDDDASLRETVGWMLRADGHTVTAVESAEAALGAMERGARPDVALVDVRLPRMSGEALTELFAQRWPDVGVVLTSGVLARPATSGPYLQKPFSRDQLRHALADALVAGRGERAPD